MIIIQKSILYFWLALVLKSVSTEIYQRQTLWDLWWTKRHFDRLFSVCLSPFLTISVHQWSIHIFRLSAVEDILGFESVLKVNIFLSCPNIGEWRTEILDMRGTGFAYYCFTRVIYRETFVEYTRRKRKCRRGQQSSILMDPYLIPRALPTYSRHAIWINVCTLRPHWKWVCCSVVSVRRKDITGSTNTTQSHSRNVFPSLNLFKYYGV
jgi:hypothetical protein